ncbi:MAG: hypothetical protein R2698_12495 [Microthrixaceae bacterium]
MTYGGTATPAQPVMLYRSEPVGGTGLAPYLGLSIEIGTGGGSGGCGGYSWSNTIYNGDVGDFATLHPDYDDAHGTSWTPTGPGDKRTFRFVLTMGDDDAAQLKSATFGFRWEVRT